jgi:hypothetical protein
MNTVSDINLAIAVWRAGGFPSNVVNMYLEQDGSINFQRLHEELDYFQNVTGSNNIVFSVQEDMLAIPGVIDIYERVSHCEILGRSLSKDMRYKNIEKIKSFGCKVILKTPSFYKDVELYDGVIFKGKHAAGKVDNSSLELDELLQKYLELFPDKHFIPSGGINSKDEVDHLLELGASVVGIGSLFAFAEESKVSYETKLKIVSSSSKDITQISSTYYPQNGIVFSDFKDDDNNNHIPSLLAGTKSPNEGHILISSKSVDQISTIKSAEQIIKELTT